MLNHSIFARLELIQGVRVCAALTRARTRDFCSHANG